jgi:hypothetical protein
MRGLYQKPNSFNSYILYKSVHGIVGILEGNRGAKSGYGQSAVHKSIYQELIISRQPEVGALESCISLLLNGNKMADDI